MEPVALRVLKEVAKRGEVSLASAIRMAKRKRGDHLDQYPLALLLEDGYLGVTFNHTPPDGAEKMREFSLAITLHMFTLPKEADGWTCYLGVRSKGMDPEKERIFLKAKGALYLDEHIQRARDRWFQFAFGVAAGLIGAWLKGLLPLP